MAETEFPEPKHAHNFRRLDELERQAEVSSRGDRHTPEFGAAVRDRQPDRTRPQLQVKQ